MSVYASPVFIASKTLLEAFNQRLFMGVMWYDRCRIEKYFFLWFSKKEVCCKLPVFS